MSQEGMGAGELKTKDILPGQILVSRIRTKKSREE